MPNSLRLPLVLIIMIFIVNSTSLFAKEVKKCKAQIEPSEIPIVGPESFNVGDSVRYCLDLKHTSCGLCEGEVCHQKLIYSWSVYRQLPDGGVGGDVKFESDNNLKCVDLAGTKSGKLTLIQDVLLRCDSGNPECFDQISRNFEIPIAVD